MSIRVKGKLISEVPNTREAEIELPPVDIAKIKEGDEVWLKVKVNTSDNLNENKDIILAHFPKTAEPKQCECDPKTINPRRYNPCPVCSKPLAPQKEIEELDLDLLNFPNERIEREQIIFFKIIVYKINEIIRKMKGAK